MVLGDPQTPQFLDRMEGHNDPPVPAPGEPAAKLEGGPIDGMAAELK